jgi:hypothetical protein
MPYDLKIAISFVGGVMVSVTIGNMFSAPIGFLTMGSFLLIYPLYEKLLLRPKGK